MFIIILRNDQFNFMIDHFKCDYTINFENLHNSNLKLYQLS